MCKALPLEGAVLSKVHWNLVYPLLMAPEPTLDWKIPDKPNLTRFFVNLQEKHIKDLRYFTDALLWFRTEEV